MKTFKNISEKEKQIFTSDFYDCWDNDSEVGKFEHDDRDNNPCPWGCPWCYAEDDKAVKAKEWFAMVRSEIIESLSEEQNIR